MTEQTKEVVTTTSQEAMSHEDQAILEQLRAGSGETEQGGNYTFIPYLTINNEKVTAKLEGGGEAEVLCPPMFLLNEKDDSGEYGVTPFKSEFRATILAVRHYVQRKYLGDNKNELPFYKSLEFKSFKSTVHVRQNKEFLPPMTYQEAKGMSPDGCENELWGVAYVLVEGEEIVRKVEVKGASRGVLFDFVSSKRELPLAAMVVKFTQEVEKGEGFSYNKLLIENTGEPVSDMKAMLDAQTKLNAILDNQESPSTPAVQGAVVPKAEVSLDNPAEAAKVINQATDPAEEEVVNKGLEEMFA